MKVAGGAGAITLNMDGTLAPTDTRTRQIC